MFSLSPATRVFLAVEPTDMRQSFNGLYASKASKGSHLYIQQLVIRCELLSGLFSCSRVMSRP